MKLFDTLTRAIKPLAPTANSVKIYVCGLTVYDEMHLGHACSSIATDVLARWLRASGLSVKLVQNFTDIDDRIIQRAQAEGVDYKVVAARYIKSAQASAASLNILPPDVAPLATEHIPQITAMIATLIERGYAYAAASGVYFDVNEYIKRGGKYGELSGRAIEDMLADANEDAVADKRAAPDFALWKARADGEPGWDSPWGAGRPGWHIECSAMAREHLGDSFDIHGGGIDLIFPHHENELAQSKAALAVKSLAGHWMHNGLLNLPGDVKMSKSLGNSLFIGAALKKHSADAIRLWRLQSHYRSPMTLRDDRIAGAERAVGRLRDCLALRSAADAPRLDCARYWDAFAAALNNDLNTPIALGALFDLRRATQNAAPSKFNLTDAQALMRRMGDALGLRLSAPPPTVKISEAEIKRLLAERVAARRAKNFAEADRLRERLRADGVQIEDTPAGALWKYIV